MNTTLPALVRPAFDALPAPFVGLRPFQSDEGGLFFGRQEQAAELLYRLSRTRFLGIVGTSGCGKSSLIRAGLIPKLQAGFLAGDRSAWQVTLMKPGVAPLHNLATALYETFDHSPLPAETAALLTALRRRGSEGALNFLGTRLDHVKANLLLLVDQFEELFHFAIESQDAAKRDEAAEFVNLLLELAEQRTLPIYVVLTLRSDYLGECENFYGLPEALNRSQYLVPRLTRQQRQQAIEGPIRLFGQKITPRLVDRVLNDVGEQADQLPVMQHALLRTWDNWRQTHDPALDWPHYEQAGGIKAALANDADGALAGMSETELLLTKRIFQALTKVDARNRQVRRQTTLNELTALTDASRPQLLAIINRFRTQGRSFLYLEDERLSADPLVDISHESLIRQWGTLKTWLEEEAQGRDIYVRLADDAERYQKGTVPLWSDPLLQIALDWYAERQPNAAWADRYHTGFEQAVQFLEASQQARAEEAECERQRQQKELDDARKLDELRQQQLADAIAHQEVQRKQVRNIKYLSVFLGMLLLSSLVAGGYAVTANASLKKSEAAQKQTNDELEKQLQTNQELLRNNEQQRVNLAAEKENALRAQEDAERNAQLAKDNANRANLNLLKAEAETMRANQLAERSQRQLAQSLALNASAIELKSGTDAELKGLLTAQSLKLRRPSDNQVLLTPESGRAARQTLAVLPRKLERFTTPDFGGFAAFSPEGQVVALLTQNNHLLLRDPLTGETKGELKNLPKDIKKISLSPAGKYLAVVTKPVTAARSNDSFLQFYDTASGQPSGAPTKFNTPIPGSLRLKFSPDNQWLLLAPGGQLWATATGRPSGPPLALANSLMAAVNDAAPAQENNLEVQNAAFSPTDQRLAVLVAGHENMQGLIAFFDTATTQRLPLILKSPRPDLDFTNLAFTPDGQMLLTAAKPLGPTGQQRLLELWDAHSGVRLAEAPLEVPCLDLQVSADGQTALVHGAAGARVLVTLRKVDKNKNRFALSTAPPVFDPVQPDALALSADGKQVLAVSPEGELLVQSPTAETTQLVLPFQNNTGTAAPAFQFSGSGQLFALLPGGDIRIWKSATEQPLSQPLAPSQPEVAGTRLVFSRTGQHLVAANDTLRLWDLSNGQSRRFDNPADQLKRVVFSPLVNLALLSSAGHQALLQSLDQETAEAWELPTALAALTAAPTLALSEADEEVCYLAGGQHDEVIIGKLRLTQPAKQAGALTSLKLPGDISQLLFLGHDKLAVASGATVHFFNAATGQPFSAPQAYASPVTQLAFANNTLAVGCQGGQLVLRRISQQGVATSGQQLDFKAAIEQVFLSSRAPYLVAAVGGGAAQVWQTNGAPKGERVSLGSFAALGLSLFGSQVTWRLLGEDGVCRQQTRAEAVPAFRYSASQSPAFLSPNGAVLITGATHRAQVLHAGDGRAWFGDELTALSPDGAYFLTARGRWLSISPTAGRRPTSRLPLPGKITQLSFTPTGKLVTVSDEPANSAATEATELPTLRSWDLAARREISKPLTLDRHISALAWLDEESFAAIGMDKEDRSIIGIWHGNKLEEKTIRLREDDFDQSELSFSADGKFLLAVNTNGAHIWEVATRLEVAKPFENCRQARFSPDGKQLACATERGVEVQAWHPDQLAAEVCQRLSRNLSAAEWEQYLDERPYELTCPNLLAPAELLETALRQGAEGDLTLATASFRAYGGLKNSPEVEARWHAYAAQRFEEVFSLFSPPDQWPDLLAETAPANRAKQLAYLNKTLRPFITQLPHLPQVLTQPHTHTPDWLSNYTETLNSICWDGSTHGFASQVRPACEIAVQLDPENANIIDSRGLARALTGDWRGAIKDFEYFIEHEIMEADERGTQRKDWITALKQCLSDRPTCRFPLDEKTLREIRGQ